MKKVRVKRIRKKNDAKKSTKKNTGKKVQGKKYVKKVREKKYGKKNTEKSKAGQDLFRSRDFVISGEKSPTRADIAQLPVVHTQNILPNRAASGHVTSVKHA